IFKGLALLVLLAGPRQCCGGAGVRDRPAPGAASQDAEATNHRPGSEACWDLQPQRRLVQVQTPLSSIAEDLVSWGGMT
ncbi:hypothetical protein V8C86DRAFT_2624734, partial [Haematococcus lacustris]